MYEHFFRLRENPFSSTPDPNFFYLSKKHQAALDHLVYGVRYRKGFLLITGEVGTGKTTLCRRLLDHLPRSTSTALILNPLFSNSHELLRAILKDFGLPITPHASPAEDIERLNQFLLDRNRGDGNAVVIVDEAQHLSNDTLEMVRMLSNLETEKRKLLQIILLGQPEMRDRLLEPALRPLNQRLTVRFHLLPLDLDETKEYIHYRLKAAGSQGEVEFFEPAFHLVYSVTEGYPRRINLLCDRVMLAAYARESFVIDRSLVDEAVRDLHGDQPEQKISIPRASRLSWTPRARRLVGTGLRYAGVTGVGASFLAAGFLAGGFFDRLDLRSLSSQLVGPYLQESKAGEGKDFPKADPGEPARTDPPWSPARVAFATDQPRSLRTGPILAEFLRLWGVTLSAGMVESLERIDARHLAHLEPVQAAGLGYMELPFSVSIARMVGYPCILQMKGDETAGDRIALLRSVDESGFRILDPAYGERLIDEKSLIESSQDVMIYLWRDYYEGQELRKDGSGPWVARLQKDLSDLGYYRGVITGYFGTLTDQAIREFQRQHRLREDGVPDDLVRMLVAKELGEEVPTL